MFPTDSILNYTLLMAKTFLFYLKSDKENNNVELKN